MAICPEEIKYKPCKYCASFFTHLDNCDGAMEITLPQPIPSMQGEETIEIFFDIVPVSITRNDMENEGQASSQVLSFKKVANNIFVITVRRKSTINICLETESGSICIQWSDNELIIGNSRIRVDGWEIPAREVLLKDAGHNLNFQFNGACNPIVKVFEKMFQVVPGKHNAALPRNVYTVIEDGVLNKRDVQIEIINKIFNDMIGDICNVPCKHNAALPLNDYDVTDNGVFNKREMQIIDSIFDDLIADICNV